MLITEGVKKIINYCVYQERCQKEVRYKLVEAGYRGFEIEEIIAYLISENYLSESRYAALYSISKLRQNQWGKIKIKNHLQQKDISEYNIRNALKSIDYEEYQNILRKIIIKKTRLENLSGISYKTEQSIITFVLNKGFEFEEIKKQLTVLKSK